MLTNGSTIGGTVPEHDFYGSGNDTSNFSEELRYSSPQDQPLRYGAGAYYYRERRVQISAASLSTVGIPAEHELAIVNPYGIPLSIWETPYGEEGKNINVAHQLFAEKSIFADGEYDILPNLTVASEYRYTDSLQQFVAVQNQYEPGVVDPLGPHISQTNQYFNTNESIRNGDQEFRHVGQIRVSKSMHAASRPTTRSSLRVSTITTPPSKRGRMISLTPATVA